MTFEEKIEAVKKNRNTPLKVSPWEITNSYGKSRRSWGLAEQVNRDLAEEGLELSGDFYHAWFYAELMLQSKKDIATTKVTTTPIKRVDSLAAANNVPTSVSMNNSLAHAITIMQHNDYSQLPVISGKGDRSLCGYISWKTIGLALWHKKEGEKVADYMSTDVTTILKTLPLLEAIPIIAEKEFVIVLNEDKTFSGIITASDIADEFLSITQAEAFLLLEQIELQIRILLGRAGILLKEIQDECIEENRHVESIDDLTFGEYCRVIQKQKHWEKLNIKTDHGDFISYMDNINKIRNEIMHFRPDGIGEEKMQALRNMARFLSEIIDYINA